MSRHFLATKEHINLPTRNRTTEGMQNDMLKHQCKRACDGPCVYDTFLSGMLWKCVKYYDYSRFMKYCIHWVAIASVRMGCSFRTSPCSYLGLNRLHSQKLLVVASFITFIHPQTKWNQIMASTWQHVTNSAVEGRTHQSSIYVDIWVQFDGCDLGCNTPDSCFFSCAPMASVWRLGSHMFSRFCGPLLLRQVRGSHALVTKLQSKRLLRPDELRGNQLHDSMASRLVYCY